jgi:hypothetical protein
MSFPNTPKNRCEKTSAGVGMHQAAEKKLKVEQNQQ